MPCLTATRAAAGGHFLWSRQNKLQVEEMASLMGWPRHCITSIMESVGKRAGTPGVVGRALGNGMQLSILERELRLDAFVIAFRTYRVVVKQCNFS